MKVKADMSKKQVKALMKDMGAEIIEAEQNGILMDVIGSIAKVFGVDLDVVTKGNRRTVDVTLPGADLPDELILKLTKGLRIRVGADLSQMKFDLGIQHLQFDQN